MSVRAGRSAVAAALFGVMVTGYGVIGMPGEARAFDPEQVFQEKKPSPRKLFRFYLTKKREGQNEEALEVLEYAADQGNQTAQWKLGRMYELGDTVTPDHRKAFEFYKRIADNYGSVRPNTPEWAITGKAMVALGHYFAKGVPEAGIAANLNESRVMFTTAAMYFRDPDGQFELGRMLLDGNDSMEEGRQAIRMLQLSSEKGHAGAMALLGHSLVEGEFVLQDKVRGLEMLTRAANIAPADMRGWIGDLQRQAFAVASEEERRQAIAAISSN